MQESLRTAISMSRWFHRALAHNFNNTNFQVPVMFFFSVLGIHSIKISCLYEIMVPFRSRTDRHAMISISLMREDKRCHGRQQKDESWLNIMVARHDDGDDSIGDRRSSSLASTWSDENRLDMERWTVAGVERCQGNED